ncbi:helix-turn-helix transcriptional regulator [Paraburkholderia azotifigens]|uniref:AlpA family phage regulatory protein n=1 Tax=Paraburkholderia azotifigens TaxID=2057004 RepID=A0ABU9RAC0_9BURK
MDGNISFCLQFARIALPLTSTNLSKLGTWVRRGLEYVSETTIQKLVREKTFPEPRLLSDRRVGWLTHEVQKWADARPVADRLPPENRGAKKRQVHEDKR